MSSQARSRQRSAIRVRANECYPRTAPFLSVTRALRKHCTLPPGVDDPEIYFEVRSGDFLADEKIAWRDAYEMQMRAAVRPLAQATE